VPTQELSACLSPRDATELVRAAVKAVGPIFPLLVNSSPRTLSNPGVELVAGRQEASTSRLTPGRVMTWRSDRRGSAG
jgi:hypothetical protein